MKAERSQMIVNTLDIGREDLGSPKGVALLNAFEAKDEGKPRFYKIQVEYNRGYVFLTTSKEICLKIASLGDSVYALTELVFRELIENSNPLLIVPLKGSLVFATRAMVADTEYYFHLSPISGRLAQS